MAERPETREALNPGSQVWRVLQEGPGDYTMPGWAPYCAATLQIALQLGLELRA